MSVHILEEARRCLNCKNPMCQRGCPIHTPIPHVIQLMLAGKLDEAAEVEAEKNQFVFDDLALRVQRYPNDLHLR